MLVPSNVTFSSMLVPGHVVSRNPCTTAPTAFGLQLRDIVRSKMFIFAVLYTRYLVSKNLTPQYLFSNEALLNLSLAPCRSI